MTAPVARRHPGTCADCGWHKPVRTVYFWVNAMPYTVCKDCEKAYRRVILWPVRVGGPNAGERS